MPGWCLERRVSSKGSLSLIRIHSFLLGLDETCEVTWHAKCNETKCGQPVPVDSDSWLYLHGNTMVCDINLTIATLVSAMNLSVNATQDSHELAILQQQLLWILYDEGVLAKYPMALGNLADLEDICMPFSVHRKTPLELFREAIESAQKNYNDCHIYPYTYLGGYHFRVGQYKKALKLWSDAAQTIKKYNYSRDDEEIYKEFSEIANDVILHIVKSASLDPNNGFTLLQDAECFAYLLRFYDGLCSWEEGSSTPVLHIGWTKPLVSIISKFPHSIRSQVAIKVNVDDDSDSELVDDPADSAAYESCEDAASVPSGKHLSTIGERRRRRAASISNDKHHLPIGKNIPSIDSVKSEVNTSPASSTGQGVGDSADEADASNGQVSKLSTINPSHPSTVDIIRDRPTTLTTDSDHDVAMSDEESGQGVGGRGKTVSILLNSKKFAGLKHLLTADKLNTSAIQLQLTALSQVNTAKRHRNGKFELDSLRIGSLTFSPFFIGAFKSGAGGSSELDFVSTTTTTLSRTTTNSNQNLPNPNKRIKKE